MKILEPVNRTRAGVYLRISDDPGEEAEGIKRQQEDCLALAQRLGYTDVTFYPENDTGASTRSRKARPKYAAMLDAARRGELDAIVAYSNSRLTRRPREVEDLIDLHDMHDIRIHTVVSGDDDLSTADGRMIARIKGNVDTAEAERISERLKRWQKQAKADGQDLGKRPFGWGRFDPVVKNGRRSVLERDKLNDFEGPALKQGIKDVLSGMSIYSVAQKWTDTGVPRSGSDGPWTISLVRNHLLRWRNAGVVVSAGQPLDGVTGVWEPACTRDELEKLRSILLNPQRSTRKGGPTPRSLLSGLATCGSCGRTLQRGTDYQRRSPAKTRVAIYRCSGFGFPVPDRCTTSMRLGLVDAEVTRVLRSILVFGPLDGLVPTNDEELRVAEIGEELDAITQAQGLVGAHLVADPRATRELLAGLNGLQARYDDLVAERSNIFSRYALKALLDRRERPVLGDDHRLDMDRVAQIAAELDDLDISQRRELVKALLKVEVRRADDLRGWPADISPRQHTESRVIITLRSNGRRLNPPPDAEW